jgi:type IX secretion system PorP/SprF family membrane protein
MKKNLLLLIVLLFSFISKEKLFAQQDPQYSQYMFNQMAINPAYAGSKDAISAATFLRTQWTNIPGAPRTETLTIHGPTHKRKVGLGGAIIADQIGPTKSIGIMGSYAYRIKIKNGKLSFGVRAGIYNYTYNWDAITYKDQADIYNTHTQTSKVVPTADAGIYYYTRTEYIGFSATHLYNGRLTTVSTESGDDARLSAHYFFTAGKGWAINDNLVINPSVCVKGAKGAPFTLDANCSFLIDKKLWVGVSGRSNKDLVVYAQVNLTEKFKLGYAFDWGFSQIAQLGYGTHELMLSYDFNIFKSKMLSPRHLYF